MTVSNISFNEAKPTTFKPKCVYIQGFENYKDILDRLNKKGFTLETNEDNTRTIYYTENNEETEVHFNEIHSTSKVCF